MKNWRILVGVVAVLAAGLWMVKPWSDDSQICGVYRTDKTINVNMAHFKVEVADTPRAREIGLSGRPCITADQAMLFVFDKPGSYPFWMKDMRFSVDIAWISTDRQVIYLEQNTKPESYPKKFVNPAAEPAQFILETQANRLSLVGVKTGMSLKF